MKPEEVKIYPPQWIWWNARLEYLLLYEPQRVKKLFRKDKNALYQELKLVVAKALLKEEDLEKKDLAKDQVQEIVMNMVAPTTAEPKEPLPENEELLIREWAERPPEGKKDRLMIQKSYREEGQTGITL